MSIRSFLTAAILLVACSSASTPAEPTYVYSRPSALFRPDGFVASLSGDGVTICVVDESRSVHCSDRSGGVTERVPPKTDGERYVVRYVEGHVFVSEDYKGAFRVLHASPGGGLEPFVETQSSYFEVVTPGQVLTYAADGIRLVVPPAGSTLLSAVVPAAIYVEPTRITWAKDRTVTRWSGGGVVGTWTIAQPVTAIGSNVVVTSVGGVVLLEEGSSRPILSDARLSGASHVRQVGEAVVVAGMRSEQAFLVVCTTKQGCSSVDSRAAPFGAAINGLVATEDDIVWSVADQVLIARRTK